MKLILIGLLIFTLQNLDAQEALNRQVSAVKKDRKHSILLEAGGRILVFGSLNYEYSLHKRVSMGVGFDIPNFHSRDITRTIAGIEETGTLSRTSTSQMIYLNYFIGKTKHKLLFTAGLTNLLTTSKYKYPSGKETSVDTEIQWNTGLGYQLSIKRIDFRLTGYCISATKDVDWGPGYFIWAGLSVGYRF